jgi:hypothetical protein
MFEIILSLSIQDILGLGIVAYDEAEIIKAATPSSLLVPINSPNIAPIVCAQTDIFLRISLSCVLTSFEELDKRKDEKKMKFVIPIGLEVRRGWLIYILSTEET